MYVVEVGPSELQDRPILIYKVRNKITNVVEVETTVLASAIEESGGLLAYYNNVMSTVAEQPNNEPKALN